MSDAVAQTLTQGLDLLPFAVSERQREQFLLYLDGLNLWNQTHNLTAVRDPVAQVTRHILDSLAVFPFVCEMETLADIGSGAGLPALMLAIVAPEMTIFAVESNRKKAAFVRQMALKLALPKVKIISERVENWHSPAPLDGVISRALASAEKFIALSGHLGDDHTRWLIMKGRSKEAFACPDFYCQAEHSLSVPLLNEPRFLVEIRRQKSQ